MLEKFINRWITEKVVYNEDKIVTTIQSNGRVVKYYSIYPKNSSIRKDLEDSMRKDLTNLMKEKLDGLTNIPKQEAPEALEPILAQIEHISDLGKSRWYEVVYFDEKWESYAGSKTFNDGERVINWRYCKDCI